MGREGVQYILIIMGRGVIKFQNFQKIKKKFKANIFHKIKKNTNGRQFDIPWTKIPSWIS